jgi:phosphohistidine phosphatase
VGTLRLTLLRHGRAQPLEDAEADFARPLTRRGRADAREMGERLALAGLIPDFVFASTAQRTRSTAMLVAAACSLQERQIHYQDELYQATAERIWALLAALEAPLRHVLICGHNPGLSRLAARLGSNPKRLDLPPAGLVTALWHDADWQSLQPHAATECECLVPEGRHRE